MAAGKSTTEMMITDTFKLFVGSWNMGGIPPPDNLSLEDLLNTQSCMADIYVFGFQEIVPLNAGNILVPENSTISKKWKSIIKRALNEKTATEKDALQKPETGDFECIISKQMVGVYITMWVRTEHKDYIRHPSFSCVGCGFLGCLKNKGSVSIRFFLHETSFCFVCCHLASGGKEGDERHRNTDAKHILAQTLFPVDPLQNLPRKILNHDRVIWLGDLNYRFDLPETRTRLLVENKEWSILSEKDQLKAELAKGRVFEGWHENEIEFAPTYKYNQNSDDYYGSKHKSVEKTMRAPAWCDRIIWFGKGLKQIQYDRVETRLSDHRPVRAVFIAHVDVCRPSKEAGVMDVEEQRMKKGGDIGTLPMVEGDGSNSDTKMRGRRKESSVFVKCEFGPVQPDVIKEAGMAVVGPQKTGPRRDDI